MSIRRKNVEQIRQSVCVETAWANSVVSRSPRNVRTASRSGYHCISACSAGGEWARVRFMLVTRPPAANWRSNSWRDAGSTCSYSNGGIRAIHDAPFRFVINLFSSSSAARERENKSPHLILARRKFMQDAFDLLDILIAYALATAIAAFQAIKHMLPHDARWLQALRPIATA